MIFENQTVLVSGAGRGIGKEIALSFAREGANIGFADVNEETAQATTREIRKLGRRVFFSHTDVSDYDKVQQFIAGAVREFGRIDVLINNAGIAKPQPFLEITARELGSPSSHPSLWRLLLLTGRSARDCQAQVRADRFACLGGGIHESYRSGAIRRCQVGNNRTYTLDGTGTG